MKDLIDYLEEQIKIGVSQLELPEKEKYKLVGQHEMLEWIKNIEDKGFPNED